MVTDTDSDMRGTPETLRQILQNLMHMRKLFCYVDETGQDTKGRLFIVSTVIIGAERENLRTKLKQIESDSGKKKKWSRSTYAKKVDYMQRVVRFTGFHECLFYARYHGTTEYFLCTLDTISKALIEAAAGHPYRATVLIDGLNKEQAARAQLELRRKSLPVRKLRGLREQSDEFIRLADSAAGLVRAYYEGNTDARLALYHEAVCNGVVRELK